jgi:hypothetical protein
MITRRRRILPVPVDEKVGNNDKWMKSLTVLLVTTPRVRGRTRYFHFVLPLTTRRNPCCDHRLAGNQNEELCYPMKTVRFGRRLSSPKTRHIILFL